MSTGYPALFSPFTLAGKRLKNRIVHASMTTRMGDKGRVTERQLHYYANRAIGGAPQTLRLQRRGNFRGARSFVSSVSVAMVERA